MHRQGVAMTLDAERALITLAMLGLVFAVAVVDLVLTGRNGPVIAVNPLMEGLTANKRQQREGEEAGLHTVSI